MRLALAQLNAVVGDLEGNRDEGLALDDARAADADLVVFPELAVTGYPPEDLLLRPGFVRAAHDVVAEIAGRRPMSSSRSSARPGSTRPRERVRGLRGRRVRASTGSTFSRTTASSTSTATSPRATTSSSSRFGDVSRPDDLRGRLAARPARDRSRSRGSASSLVNLSASPYHVGKAEDREEMLVTRARDYERLFRVLQPRRRTRRAGLRRALGRSRRRRRGRRPSPGFAEHLLVFDVEPPSSRWARSATPGAASSTRSRETVPPGGGGRAPHSSPSA